MNSDMPTVNEYPKLVRDRIPEIIKQREGQDVPIRYLSDDSEYLVYLLKKVIEEATELSEATADSNIQEEIADIYEVIDVIIKLKMLSVEEIRAIQVEKRKKRGGFARRLLMLGNSRDQT
jgi:predicted house-cleaning noncanonical NTP pyrophosphatase (MazG superfamily)